MDFSTDINSDLVVFCNLKEENEAFIILTLQKMQIAAWRPIEGAQ